MSSLLLLPATLAHAGSYDPVLIVGQAVSTGTGSPALLTLEGNWSFDDILQVDFPLSVVVRQGTVFARFPVGGDAVSGTFAGLADGLSAGEVPSLEQAGAPDAAAAFTRLTAHEIVLTLPPIFAPGPLTVVLYAQLAREGTLLSNVVTSRGDGS